MTHSDKVWLRAPACVQGLLLALLAVCTLGCETLLGSDLGKPYRVVAEGQLIDGGYKAVVEPIKSCADNNANCGSFKDNDITVFCGSCTADQVCVDNRCTCNPSSCSELGAECGYRSNGCNTLQFCGSCEQKYPNDPTKAQCNVDGTCGSDTGLATTCEEVRAQGQPAECGDVGVGETLLSCGACAGRELCSNNECGGYAPLKCAEITGGGALCGAFPDGNGGAITCGCGVGEVCTGAGLCCTPRTECPAEACGSVSDGCGGTIDCGGCGAGQACTNNVCCTDNPQCPTGACGEVNICGKTLLCGECAGEECCVKDAQGMGRCHTPSCPNNGLCGDNMPDGCGMGGTKDNCECPGGLTCSDGRCECIPRTCPADGTMCGQIDDGCGAFVTCGCDSGQTCVDGQCCTPTCPADACGLQPDGCGGLITCNICGPGDVCNDGVCMTPSCPDNAVCGSNEANGVVLACLGSCSNGQPCSAQNGTYACGDCSAVCPESGTCGLTDLGCTHSSCPGTCGLDGQVCVNRAATGGLDNYQCCSAHCPVAQSIACGAYQDPTCPGTQASCAGSCQDGERCVATDGVYACKVVNCPSDARCGSNEVDGVVVQCDGSCSEDNEVCVREGSTYSCICAPDEDPCGDSCGTTAEDGCSSQAVPCTCSGTDACIDGSCCSPQSALAACQAAGANCGAITEPNCGVERQCGDCASDQTCVDTVCACDQTKCAAHETCDDDTLSCECDSSKCPAGQECDTDGSCTCDDDQCEDGRVCDNSGLCACPQTPLQACAEADAECGTALNECGETVNCPPCAPGWECDVDTCVCAESIEETCSEFECAGVVANACGQMVDCSTVKPCDTGFACSGGSCVCTQTRTTACSSAGAECGSVMNICGQLVDCPTCPTNQTCDGNDCKCNETPAQACARLGAECGTVTDLCGDTVTCVNSCMAPEVCAPGGNTCMCGQTNGAACTAASAECGSVTNECGVVVACTNTCDALTETCAPGGTTCECTQTDIQACAGRECGPVMNLCGDEVDCGDCDTDNNEICESNQCVCSDPDPCGARVCGSVVDACGETRACGEGCQSGTQCNDGGTACE